MEPARALVLDARRYGSCLGGCLFASGVAAQAVHAASGGFHVFVVGKRAAALPGYETAATGGGALSAKWRHRLGAGHKKSPASARREICKAAGPAERAESGQRRRVCAAAGQAGVERAAG